jgi:azurin
MYQHLVLSLVLAAAPFASQATPATQKPAPTTKPAGSTQKPPADKPAAADTKGAAAKGVRTIEIIGTEDMKFSQTAITAKPGEQLRVRLVVKGTMPKAAMAHNFVLLTKTANQVEFATAAMNARATDFIPAEKKADVVAFTGLAGAGETVEVTFKVPAAAGQYPYICSFPGHFQVGMKGTLTVK